MKFTILLLCVFSVAFAACKSSGKEPSKELANSAVSGSELPLTKAEFRVNGMHCTGCENTIKTNIKEIKGVALVEASFKDNLAVVSFDSTKTNETEIAAAIKDAGYKVDTFMRK